MSSIFTARNEVGARLYFYRHLLFWFCPQGGTWAGTPPGPGTPTPQDQVHPQTRYTPRTRYLPGSGTPPGPGAPPLDQVHPPDQVHTPRPGTPPGTRYTPQEQCMMGDTGHKRAVRILLECILVLKFVYQVKIYLKCSNVLPQI